MKYKNIKMVINDLPSCITAYKKYHSYFAQTILENFAEQQGISLNKLIKFFDNHMDSITLDNLNNDFYVSYETFFQGDPDFIKYKGNTAFVFSYEPETKLLFTLVDLYDYEYNVDFVGILNEFFGNSDNFVNIYSYDSDYNVDDFDIVIWYRGGFGYRYLVYGYLSENL